MTKFLVAYLLLTGVSCFAADQAPHQIVMKSISYEPKTLNIKAGESVEWINKSLTQHSATSDDGKAFDTGLIDPQKKSKVLKMNQAGTFEYHCSVHGKTMHATLIVE